MIESVFKSSAAMTIVLMAWLLVQAAYRRMLAGDPAAREVRDGCWTCHDCGLPDSGPGCSDSGPGYQGATAEPAAEPTRDESRTQDCVFPG